MKRIIAGGTGFIGQALIKRWLAQNHNIIVIGRSVEKIKKIFNGKVQAVTWQEWITSGTTIAKNAEAIINLAGANLGNKFWTQKYKQEILTSRVDTTTQLVQVCAKLGANSPPLFNANGVGVYGVQQPLPQKLPPAFDEETEIDFKNAPNFLSNVARSWELATLPAQNAGVRVVLMRFGVVLAKNGGVLPRLSLPVRLFFGGPLGSGQQAFSWIALKDLCHAIEFLLQQSHFAGPVNLVAPHCVTQKQCVQALSKVLHRPSFIHTPAFILKLVLGEMAEELLLSGQHVYPKRLLKLGFTFQYPTIESALNNIYSAK